MGIQYTTTLLENKKDQLDYLDLYKKKDDMCDSYLQGRYYLECVRNKSLTKSKSSTKFNHNISQKDVNSGSKTVNKSKHNIRQKDLNSDSKSVNKSKILNKSKQSKNSNIIIL